MACRSCKSLRPLMACMTGAIGTQGCWTGSGGQPLLPELNRDQVRRLLEELRHENRIHRRGEKRWSRWHPGPQPGEAGEES